MVSTSSLVLLSALGVSVAGTATTVEIAPGVHMPLLNSGVSNRTVWVQAGGKGLDTALCYGDADQKEVGDVVRASGRARSELFVTTKMPCCPGGGFPYGVRYCGSHPGLENATANILHDFDMLGLDYIDLLVMHWGCDTFENTVERYMRLEPFVRAGKIRAIGVSNFNASLLEAFVAKVSIKPAVNQVAFSIGGHWQAEQPYGSDDATLAKSRELGVTLSAYAPLGGTSGVDVLHDPHVVAVASAHGVSTAQVALRWLIQQGIPAVTATDSPAHAASDLATYDLELTDEEMRSLAAVSPTGTQHASIVV